MKPTLAILVGLAVMSSAPIGQSPERPPVIDIHTHIDIDQVPELMSSLNIRYLVFMGRASASPGELTRLDRLTGGRYVPSLSFPCPGGTDVIFGTVKCSFGAATEFPDIQWLRGELQAGRVRAFGEVLPQYLGLGPGDARMEPYWALAEELDMPVGIHVGPGLKALFHGFAFLGTLAAAYLLVAVG